MPVGVLEEVVSPVHAACLVCDTELSGNPSACPKCGVPALLQAEAAAILRERDPFIRPAPSAASTRKATPSRHAPRPAATPLDPIADDIDRSRALLQRLGTPSEELVGEVRRAALLDAEGRSEEAAGTLGAAQTHGVEALRTELERRTRELDVRQTAFSKEGFGSASAPSITEIQRLLAQKRYHDVVPRLLETESRIRRLSEELEAVRAPLGNVAELLEVAHRAGLEFPEEAQRSGALRKALAEPGALPSDFARIAEQAEELRAALLERVPASIRQELEQHETTLRNYPDDHAPALAARDHHARSVEHLESGRLADAAAALAALRESIEALGPAPLPRVEVESARSEPPAGSSVSVPELVQTARQLATRVRALDPGSELAFEAATQIRQATELLRARRLDEAAHTLHQLMAALDRAELPPERSVPT
jgi:hypothetical protein